MKMILTKKEKQLLHVLGEGEDNIKRSKDIAKELNIDIRTLRHLIAKLVVRHNVPIVGKRQENNSGYFIAVTPSEVLEAVRTYLAQIREEQKRIGALTNADLFAWKKLREERTA